MTTYAILTGDIVNSTKLTPADVDRCIAALQAASEDISGWHPSLNTGFARRGGDGWQMALSETRCTLRATLYCQSVLRRMDDRFATRIAVAEGPGTLPPDGNPNAGHGEAFIASGRTLETMDRHTALKHASAGPTGAIYRLAAALTEGWTVAKAQAISRMLPPGNRTQEDVAHILGIKRPTVQRALSSGHYRALQDALSLLETHDG